ncbi:MAG: hypothetical protein H8E17_04120 [Deltaproteobacteria bacterium]|nr:hypothetical protein [Deltaproteobacteria bacterium]
MKDIDLAARTEFIKVFVRLCPIIAIIGLVFWGVTGFIIAILLSFLATKLIISFAGGIGGTFGRLFSGRRPIYSLLEQFEGDLDQARHHKMQNRFDKALEIVETVVAQAPDLPQALFLKAQILWEGFGDIEQSKDCLRKVMTVVTDKNDTIYRWASSLYQEIITQKQK